MPGGRSPKTAPTIYLRSNGVHIDIVMPAEAQGLSWPRLLPPDDVRDPPLLVRWYGFGAGERRVYLETPTWGDITPKTLWSALTGGERVLHVDQTAEPGSNFARSACGPRNIAGCGRRSAPTSTDRRGQIDHPGYGPEDAFYEGRGRASAIHTCNQWVADKLRLAGVRTSLWSPFPAGLLWRYREAADQPG